MPLSIVGIDRGPAGYYAAKLQQERAIAAGPVPVTVLRACFFATHNKMSEGAER